MFGVHQFVSTQHFPADHLHHFGWNNFPPVRFCRRSDWHGAIVFLPRVSNTGNCCVSIFCHTQGIWWRNCHALRTLRQPSEERATLFTSKQAKEQTTEARLNLRQTTRTATINHGQATQSTDRRAHAATRNRWESAPTTRCDHGVQPIRMAAPLHFTDNHWPPALLYTQDHRRSITRNVGLQHTRIHKKH